MLKEVGDGNLLTQEKLKNCKEDANHAQSGGTNVE